MTDVHQDGPATSALDKAREASAAMRAAGVKARRLDPIEKAKRRPTSLRLAITAKCWGCQGGDSDPAPRQRIGTCSVTRCPLHPVRPWKSDESDEGEER